MIPQKRRLGVPNILNSKIHVKRSSIHQYKLNNPKWPRFRPMFVWPSVRILFATCSVSCVTVENEWQFTTCIMLETVHNTCLCSVVVHFRSDTACYFSMCYAWGSSKWRDLSLYNTISSMLQTYVNVCFYVGYPLLPLCQ